MAKMDRKRKFADDEDDEEEVVFATKKHTLDSDEEDSDDGDKVEMHPDDVEGEEEGVANERDEIKITPFNMREELEEGHFDKDGHYHFDKNAEIKDNWLDNIDWMKIKKETPKEDANALPAVESFNELQIYKQILEYLQPNETIETALKRLGKGRAKISSAERLKRKKLGIVDEVAEKISKLSELANEILTKTGNMDVYQEAYESIQTKIGNTAGTSANAEPSDMFADEFDANKSKEAQPKEQKESNVIAWEYKVNQDDSVPQGPFSTEQMLKWQEEKHFKQAVYVRKVGDSTNFYSSDRVDFDLYL